MQKILYVTSEFGDRPNAVAIRAKFHVAALADSGFRVVVVTSGGSDQSTGIRVIGVGRGLAPSSARFIFRLASELWFGFKLAVVIALHPGRFDVVISSPPFVAGVLAFISAKLRRARLVVDVRDRYPQVLFSLGLIRKDSVFGRLLRWIERVLYRRSAAVVTVTKSLAAAIEEETSVSVQVIRNGYDDGKFFPSGPPDSDGRTVRVIVHGLFGQLFDASGFLALAEHCATAAVPNEFWVVGYGPKLSVIEQAALPNVRVFGARPQGEIAEFLRACDIGVSVHSFQESSRGGFAVKVFEYIGVGLPALVTPVNEGGLEVAAHGMGATFDSAASPDAQSTLRSWIEDSVLRSALREAALAKRDLYSRQAQAQRFASLIRGCFGVVSS